MLDDALIVI